MPRHAFEVIAHLVAIEREIARLARFGDQRPDARQVHRPRHRLGKSLNIAPPGWQQTFGPLRDAFNHEHGWSRPDDAARARADQPGHRAYIDAAKLRAGLEVEADPREVIRDYLVQRVEHGVVRDRADVVAALKEAGLDVPRQGKDLTFCACDRPRQPPRFCSSTRPAASANVGTPRTRRFSERGSPPERASIRLASACSRALASGTSVAAPSPSSQRRRLVINDFSTVIYSPYRTASDAGGTPLGVRAGRTRIACCRCSGAAPGSGG